MRFTLRPLTPVILQTIFSSRDQASICRELGVNESGYLHYLEMVEKGMETHRISLHSFLLIRHEDGAVLGECGFHTWNKTHRRAEVFYAMRSEEFMRQGYMSEALPEVLKFGFTEMGLHRIEALIDPANTPSLKLLQKNGFVFEGTMRGDYKVGDINEDSDCYSLLLSEWNTR